MVKYIEILQEICHKNGIKLTNISHNWVHILEKNKETRYILGYHFDTNPSAVSSVLDDKYAFYELMEYKKFPIIKHEIIFNNYDRDKIKELFHKFSNDVVLKANLGSCGRNVFWISDLNSLYQKIDELLIKNFSLSICPYVDIKREYRVLILNNHVELIYGKIKPTVIGDGHSRIDELLTKFNPAFFSDKKDLPTTVLSKGEIYEYNWQFNLSQGAQITFDIPDELKTRLESLAIAIAKEINIKFCSIDLIVTKNDEIYIMEANSGVMMENIANIIPNGKKVAERIYEKAIKSMFNE